MSDAGHPPGRTAPATPVVLLALVACTGCEPQRESSSADRLEALEARVAHLEERLESLPDAGGLDAAAQEELAGRLASDDLVTRYRAGAEIARRGASARPVLFDALAHGDEKERRAAAATLAGSDVSDVVSDLVEAHDRERASKVRALLATALGRSRSDEAVPPLVADLWHESRTVRIAALLALGRLEAPQATVPLLQVALSERQPEALLARDALLSLDARAVLFVESEWPRLDPRERRDVLEIVGALEGEAVDELLREGLRDASPLVALAAARALARRGDPAGRRVALERLGSDDPVVARAAREVVDLYDER